jgi:hypothetical protein
MPNKPGRPRLTAESIAVPLRASITPEDMAYLLSISPNVSAAIRQIIKEHKEQQSCNSR